jgi:hypothetical protein
VVRHIHNKSGTIKPPCRATQLLEFATEKVPEVEASRVALQDLKIRAYYVGTTVSFGRAAGDNPANARGGVHHDARLQLVPRHARTRADRWH